MLVKDFITKEIPVLKSFDTAEYALALMEDFKLKHLPLLSDNAYQCLVSEKDLLALPDRKSTRLNSSHMPKSRMPSSA